VGPITISDTVSGTKYELMFNGTVRVTPFPGLVSSDKPIDPKINEHDRGGSDRRLSSLDPDNQTTPHGLRSKPNQRVFLSLNAIAKIDANYGRLNGDCVYSCEIVGDLLPALGKNRIPTVNDSMDPFPDADEFLAKYPDLKSSGYVCGRRPFVVIECSVDDILSFTSDGDNMLHPGSSNAIIYRLVGQLLPVFMVGNDDGSKPQHVIRKMISAAADILAATDPDFVTYMNTLIPIPPSEGLSIPRGAIIVDAQKRDFKLVAKDGSILARSLDPGSYHPCIRVKNHKNEDCPHGTVTMRTRGTKLTPRTRTEDLGPYPTYDLMIEPLSTCDGVPVSEGKYLEAPLSHHPGRDLVAEFIKEPNAKPILGSLGTVKVPIKTRAWQEGQQLPPPKEIVAVEDVEGLDRQHWMNLGPASVFGYMNLDKSMLLLNSNRDSAAWILFGETVRGASEGSQLIYFLRKLYSELEMFARTFDDNVYQNFSQKPQTKSMLDDKPDQPCYINPLQMAQDKIIQAFLSSPSIRNRISAAISPEIAAAVSVTTRLGFLGHPNTNVPPLAQPAERILIGAN